MGESIPDLERGATPWKKVPSRTNGSNAPRRNTTIPNRAGTCPRGWSRRSRRRSWPCSRRSARSSRATPPEAILAQNKATDQWAFFQAKSTKEQIFDVGSQVVAVLSEGTAQADRAKPALERLRGEVQRYEREKDEIRREAERWEEESRHEHRKHTRFALGIALFQVGIVLASVSLLVRFRWLHVLSLATGVAGLACLIVGRKRSVRPYPLRGRPGQARGYGGTVELAWVNPRRDRTRAG
jgi:hypothetical protein